MINSEILKKEFEEYVKSCVLSRRPASKTDFIIGKTASESYISFLEPEKLFSYNQERWQHIKRIYDISRSEEIYAIIKELFNDDEFNKVDNEGASQYFRSNAIKQYYCFLRSREVFNSSDNTVFLYKKTGAKFDLPLQQIFYGAPGTGKSHTIDDITKNESVIRTTFHPDSDYSTFVGAYKPTMGLHPICDELGQPMKIGGTVLHKEQIVYEFVDQAFLQAYVQAWKNIIFYNGKKQYLVIEEINRGNCAQIFGDLFQLLDRNSAGFSDYPINADKDLQKYLKKVFARMDEPNKQIFLKSEEKQHINSLYKGGEDIVCKVLSGEILLLPNNLYIWATMNTSDQSLFPIDSAFKRRWDWKYVPIKYTNSHWRIVLGDKKYSWDVFQKKINDKIKDATEGSEDKLLGDFFVKAKNNVIDEDLLLNKIVFYLWNDVCKDGEGDIFKIKNGDKTENISFSQFFDINKTAKLQQWMDYLGVDLFDEKNKASGDNQVDNNSIDDPQFSQPIYRNILMPIKLKCDDRKIISRFGGQNSMDIKFDNIPYIDYYLAIALNNTGDRYIDIKLWIESSDKAVSTMKMFEDLGVEDTFNSYSNGDDIIVEKLAKDASEIEKKVRGWRLRKKLETFEENQVDSFIEWIYNTVMDLRSKIVELVKK